MNVESVFRNALSRWRDLILLGLGLALLCVEMGVAHGQTWQVHALKSDQNGYTARLTDHKGTIFFFLDVNHYWQLWKSDGTDAGTVMIREFEADDYPGAVDHVIISMNNWIFFAASDGVHGTELWKSDGTAGGTVMVKDILPGAKGSHPELKEIPGTTGVFYFAAMDGGAAFGTQLWKSDGTAIGTVLVADSPGSKIKPWGAVGNVVFATGGYYGLWRSDGTPAGTFNLSTGFEVGQVVNGKFYFLRDDPANGQELWISDGTAAGTGRLRDKVVAGTDSNPYYPPPLMTACNNRLFLVLDDRVAGGELWCSDGTAAGTVMLKDINPGFGGSEIRGLCVYKGKLYFFASSTGTSWQLWQSDGTPAGTVPVSGSPLWNGNIGTPAICNNLMYFVVDYNVYYKTSFLPDDDIGVWESDGTGAGTKRIITSPLPKPNLTVSNNRMFSFQSGHLSPPNQDVATWSLFTLRWGPPVPVEFSSFSVN